MKDGLPLRGGKRTGAKRTLGPFSLFQTGCQIEVQDIFFLVLNHSVIGARLFLAWPGFIFRQSMMIFQCWDLRSDL